MHMQIKVRRPLLIANIERARDAHAASLRSRYVRASDPSVELWRKKVRAIVKKANFLPNDLRDLTEPHIYSDEQVERAVREAVVPFDRALKVLRMSTAEDISISPTDVYAQYI
jgi:hypothetical protein